MSRNIVIIPVRGNSKRLPQKNIKPLGGIPLFIHSVNYAKNNSKLCHEIVVSTEDETIKRIAKEHGVKVIDRPKELALDTTPTKDVLKHVIDTIDGTFDNVILLQATNPFREKNLLTKAFKIYNDHNYDSLITVSENRQKFGKISNDKFIPYNYHFGQRSQDLEPLYYENGLLYISKVALVKKGEIIGEKNYPYIERNFLARIDIDEEEDFELAEYYYNKYNKQ